jgi:hypothetical protein
MPSTGAPLAAAARTSSISKSPLLDAVRAAMPGRPVALGRDVAATVDDHRIGMLGERSGGSVMIGVDRHASGLFHELPEAVVDRGIRHLDAERAHAPRDRRDDHEPTSGRHMRRTPPARP